MSATRILWFTHAACAQSQLEGPNQRSNSTLTTTPIPFTSLVCFLPYLLACLFLFFFRTVTAKVAGKYQDVRALEQSVAELHQMFLDFALLVEQQGELLNNIEHQVRQAADHVEEANKDVHQSIELQKSVRKKQV